MKKAYILFFAGLATVIVAWAVPLTDSVHGFILGVGIGLMLIAAFLFGRGIARMKKAE